MAVQAAGAGGQTDPSLDLADGRAAEALLGEQVERGVEDPVVGLRPCRWGGCHGDSLDSGRLPSRAPMGPV